MGIAPPPVGACVDREARAVGDVPLTADELAVVVRVGHAVAGLRNRASLLPAVAGAVAEVLPADRVVLLSRGARDGGDLGVHVSPSGGRFEGEGDDTGSVLAWVMRRGEAMVVSSPEAIAERFPATHRALVDDGMASMLVLPLRTRDRAVGALGFVAARPGSFAGPAPRLLEEIGLLLGAALESCLAHERLEGVNRELGALVDVGRAVGRHLDRDELFGALATCLREVVPTDRFGIELPMEGGRLQGHLLTPRGATTQPTQPTVLPARGTACDWVLRHRRWIVVSRRDELRERFPTTFRVMETEAMESLCALPLITGEDCRAVLFFMAGRPGAYESLRRGLLEQVASAVAGAMDDCLAHEEVASLRDRLAAENVYLQEEIQETHNFRDIVGRSAALRAVLSRVDVVAPTPTSVLILGETGTGKELIARAIHDHSPRRARPLVKVNCAAIASGLIESELFGHEKGAFTGATGQRIGRFELADGGTIFLDEIGEMPPALQVKLLRVLQEREFERVGGSEVIRVDVRLIAATNRDLQQAVTEGAFREDLYYRLNVFPIELPPLRDRREDIPLFVHHFLERLAGKVGRRIGRVPSAVLERLMAYPWPGNVRELENVVERALILSRGPELEVAPELLPAPAPVVAERAPASTPASLEDVEREHIVAVLRQVGWRIEGPTGAARLLAMAPSTLRSRMQKLAIRRGAHPR
jgi:formate hydrogenlyase transcriptional activator